MKDNWMTKGLVISIILLFIGVSVAPSINQSVVKASQDDDLIEVTTQACGIKGYGNTTVKLTREQYQNLEEYLVEFRARLNQTSTREEAVPLFKDAVVELNRYGLLPRGMGVAQVQRVITEEFLYSRLLAQDNNSNYFCLIAGKSNDCRSIGPVGFSIHVLLFILCHLLYAVYDWFAFIVINVILVAPIYQHSEVKIFNLFGVLTFGHHYTIDYPSNGWVFTSGLMGVKRWNNTFIGGLYPTFVEPNDISSYSCAGVSGFSGIRILFPDESTSYFIGSALRVRLLSE